MFKLVLEKAEELEIKLPTSIESYKKQDNRPSKSMLFKLTTQRVKKTLSESLSRVDQ